MANLDRPCVSIPIKIVGAGRLVLCVIAIDLRAIEIKLVGG